MGITFLSNLSKDIEGYVKDKTYLKKVYLLREDDRISIYFFTKEIERIPSNTFGLEKRLKSRYKPFIFDVKVAPYEKGSVEKYAGSYDLIPVIS